MNATAIDQAQALSIAIPGRKRERMSAFGSVICVWNRRKADATWVLPTVTHQKNPAGVTHGRRSGRKHAIDGEPFVAYLLYDCLQAFDALAKPG